VYLFGGVVAAQRGGVRTEERAPDESPERSSWRICVPVEAVLLAVVGVGREEGRRVGRGKFMDDSGS